MRFHFGDGSEGFGLLGTVGYAPHGVASGHA